MDNNKRHHVGATLAFVVVLALAVVVLLAKPGLTAHAVAVQAWSKAHVPAQPYGGCKEAWQAPRSEGANTCRKAGWTVHKRFVLNPRRVPVYLRMDPCEVEDSPGPCFWNALVEGNGEGQSFIRGAKDRVHPVRFIWYGGAS